MGCRWDSDYQFRKQAIAVQGVIVHKSPGQRYTSFFIRYDYEGIERAAEYCRIGGDSLQVGQTVTILIDPKSPPDSKVPKHNVASAGIDWGNCILPTTPLWAPWAFLYIVAAVVLIVLWLR